MLWGVIIGCYSTVYVASPMILHFHLTRESVGQAAGPPTDEASPRTSQP
jgi:preprotein translocase subunit SecF